MYLEDRNTGNITLVTEKIGVNITTFFKVDIDEFRLSDFIKLIKDYNLKIYGTT